MILLMDNFRTYPATDDMIVDGGKGGPWTTFNNTSSPSGISLVENPTWKTDGSALRAFRNGNTSDRSSPQRDFSDSSHAVVCAQFVCGSSNETASPSYTESCNFVLFQSPVLDRTTVTNTTLLSTFYGVSVRAISSSVGSVDTVGVYYTIPTSSAGNTNELLIGRLRPWTRGRHYHVELKVDHSGPTARIIVYVNGVLELDKTYDRDRIDSGFQTTEFQRVLLGGQGTPQASRPTLYSNLVIYTDDAATPFPLGPVDIETVSPTAGQGYDGLRAAPNADDSTFLTIQPGASVSGSFVDLSASANPVLAVDAIVRHGAAAGLDPSQITTQIKKADGSVSASILTAAAPGLPPLMRRVRLPAAFSAADVNGATFTINAAGS